MPQKLIDQTTIQPDGRPGDDAFTAFATCNENFADAEGRLSALEGGSSNIGQDVADLKAGLLQETQLRVDADVAEATARQALAQSLGARLIGRNVLINGDFRIPQRGANFPVAATARYSLDRWFLWGAGSQIGGSQQNADSVALPVTLQNRPRNAFYVAVSSVAGANNFALLQQRIEDVRTLSGGKVTFSGWMWSDAAKTISVNFYQLFGTTGASDTVKISAQKINLPSQTWTYVTLTFDMPHVAGKTITANNTLWLNIWLDAGAGSDGAADAGGIGQKSGTYWFSQLQLEAGSNATPFEIRNDAVELALCQRYYEKSYSLGVPPGTSDRNSSYRCSIVNGYFFAAGTIAFAVQKRSAPAITVYAARDGTAGAGSEVNATGVFVANRQVGPSNIGTSQFQTGSNNGGAAAGNTIEFHWAADAEL